MKHTPPTNSFDQLEPRTLLSLAYYDFFAIEDMPGFPGGEPGALAGASENGEYLWSIGAAGGSTGDSPSFLVAGGVYRPLAEFAGLADSRVEDINSTGTVLGFDQNDQRLFLLDLASDGQRRYLDTMIVDAPAGFELSAVSALELGDDGIVVLADNTNDWNRGGRVWGLLGGVVHELWRSAVFTSQVFIGPDNAVYAHRYLLYDRSGGGSDEVDVVRWTPEEGLVVIDGLSDIYGANSRGDLLGYTGTATGVLSPTGEFREVARFDVSSSRGLDDSGIVAGVFDDGGNYPIYFTMIYDETGAVPLEDRGGPEDEAVTLTDSGLILLKGGVSRRLAPGDLVRAGGDQAVVVIDRSGREIVSFTSARGDPGSISIWSEQVDFGAYGHGPYGRFDQFDQEIVGLLVPRTGVAQRWIVANGGALHETYNGEHDRFEPHWAALPTPVNGVRPTAFLNPHGNGVFAFCGPDGRLLVQYEQRATWDYEQWVWKTDDLTRNHLDRRGLATPEFVGRLEGFSTGWGAMNIIGLDAAGQVHAVWWSPALGSSGWSTTNLSALTGAPRLAGNLAATATPWGAMQIFGADAEGHLVGLWWSPTSHGWHTTDLTTLTDGLLLDSSTLTVQMMPWGGISIVGKSAEGEVGAYWWNRHEGWASESISQRLPGEAPDIPGPVSYQATPGGTQHIAAVDAAGHVVELYWLRDGNGWQWRDLTAMAIG